MGNREILEMIDKLLILQYKNLENRFLKEKYSHYAIQEINFEKIPMVGGIKFIDHEINLQKERIRMLNDFQRNEEGTRQDFIELKNKLYKNLLENN